MAETLARARRVLGGSPDGTFVNVMVRSPDGQLPQVTDFGIDRLTVVKQP